MLERTDNWLSPHFFVLCIERPKKRSKKKTHTHIRKHFRLLTNRKCLLSCMQDILIVSLYVKPTCTCAIHTLLSEMKINRSIDIKSDCIYHCHGPRTLCYVDAFIALNISFSLVMRRLIALHISYLGMYLVSHAIQMNFGWNSILNWIYFVSLSKMTSNNLWRNLLRNKQMIMKTAK